MQVVISKTGDGKARLMIGKKKITLYGDELRALLADNIVEFLRVWQRAKPLRERDEKPSEWACRMADQVEDAEKDLGHEPICKLLNRAENAESDLATEKDQTTILRERCTEEADLREKAERERDEAKSREDSAISLMTNMENEREMVETHDAAEKILAE
jgi:hypothetical protein